jgi:hypothetical protein
MAERRAVRVLASSAFAMLVRPKISDANMRVAASSRSQSVSYRRGTNCISPGVIGEWAGASQRATERGLGIVFMVRRAGFLHQATPANVVSRTRASSRHCGAVRVALIDDKAPVAISLALRDYLLPVLVDI